MNHIEVDVRCVLLVAGLQRYLVCYFEEVPCVGTKLLAGLLQFTPLCFSLLYCLQAMYCSCVNLQSQPIWMLREHRSTNLDLYEWCGRCTRLPLSSTHQPREFHEVDGRASGVCGTALQSDQSSCSECSAYLQLDTSDGTCCVPALYYLINQYIYIHNTDRWHFFGPLYVDSAFSRGVCLPLLSGPRLYLGLLSYPPITFRLSWDVS